MLSHNLTCVQFILPKSLKSFHKAEYNESLTTEVNNDNMHDIYLLNSNVSQHYKSFDENTMQIYYAHSSKKRLWLLRSIYSPDNNQSISHYVNYYYRESFDSVFEPHGGIEVAICLLGELVCQSHSSNLISYGLKLLFTMLHHSSIMYAKFYAPALSHPGLENSMERRHKKLWLFQNCNNQLNCKPVPLSFGHCLLARLFKHPKFNMISSKSYEIMKVLLNEIILTFTVNILCKKSMNHTSSIAHLLINPSLLRCLILFGSQSFWYPSSKQQQQQSGFGNWSPCAPLVWNQGFPTPLGRSSVSTNPIKASDIRFSSFQFRKQQYRRENAVMTNEPSKTGATLESIHRQSLYNNNNTDYIHSFYCAKRLCLLNLCRLIINLDANMYLSAAEQVFYTMSDYNNDDDDPDHKSNIDHQLFIHNDELETKVSTSTSPLSMSTSQISLSTLDNDYLFWHKITRKCLNYTERLKFWEYLSFNHNKVIGNSDNSTEGKCERMFISFFFSQVTSFIPFCTHQWS
ncbi:unnamed protein product [Schistosoma mattheei]|uniref:Uncharacterized protein n=1 Tax=Schistosoma mattheei TaxID=31246 RepID=A0A3P8EI28_9TREM|nr:unnamed protein product [Schistosoma mattheei]